MNAITTQKSFQERIKDRIKNSIGELMTDKELSEIVNRAMEEIFFKPTIIQDRYTTKETPPFIHQLLKELLTENVNKAVSEYILNHKEDVQKAIQRVVSVGMGKALMNAISLQFNNDLMNFQNDIMDNIQNR